MYDRDHDREGDRVREYVRRSRDRVRHQDYGGRLISNKNSIPKCNRIKKHKEKESGKYVVQLMRKILKGQKGSGGMIDNASADKKLNKILHMFHRNVHPESTTKSQNRSGHVMNSSYVNDEGYKRRDQMMSGERRGVGTVDNKQSRMLHLVEFCS
nr:protein LAZY 1-like [Tanacetum cinerariifolium]